MRALLLTILCVLVSTPAWASSLEWSGDARLRLDLDQRSGNGVVDDASARTRARLRARGGLVYDSPLEGLSMGLRLATNVSTPGNSPHQNFDMNQGGGLGNPITLDRAWVRFAFGGGTKITAGKQGWPHWQQTEAFWDEDIQPEGIVAQYGRALGDGMTLGANLGWFYVATNNWTDAFFANDTFGTWQLRYQATFGKTTGTVAVTGAHFRDRSAFSNVVADVNGSTTHLFLGTDFYTVAAQLKLNLDPVTVTAGGDVLLSNADADTVTDGQNNGFVAQVRVGYGRYALRYYFYDVGETSVPFWSTHTFAQDNFPNSRGGGLTGFTGHRIQADAKIAEGVSADVRIYQQQGKADNILAFSEVRGRTINRYQLNFNLKF